ncbi:hypothetical protein B0T24DRAFT_265857 [Lasiosphaeria ovina]|uniref:Uncharacterized protein n=1 Tax=Lasiosphaeria ovina TaxID=92902 RepID=A0AAE0KCA9_9PEZI|nr:hypothetical protein B0T24DRAFT_265857 [Lasiosphaeria ovina]
MLPFKSLVIATRLKLTRMTAAALYYALCIAPAVAGHLVPLDGDDLPGQHSILVASLSGRWRPKALPRPLSWVFLLFLRSRVRTFVVGDRLIRNGKVLGVAAHTGCGISRLKLARR